MQLKTYIKMTGLLFILVFSLVFDCQGFLLHDKDSIQTTAESSFDQQHYNMLVNLVLTERNDRLKLEKTVSRLQKELLATQQGVTDIYDLQITLNETNIQQAIEIKAVNAENVKLRNDYNSLRIDFNKLKSNLFACKNKTNALQKDVVSLKQLKSVADLQIMLSLKNQTDVLENQVQATRSELSHISNEIIARKQDFIALFNKADTTEKRLELSVQKLENDLNISRISTRDIRKQQVNQSKKIDILREDMNSTKEHFQHNLSDIQQLYSKQPNRVAVTACAPQGKTFPAGTQINFPFITTKKGISDATLLKLKNNGTFTCEKTGLYLISLFITTPTHVAYTDLYKNGIIVATMIFSLNGSYQTNSMTVVLNLSSNDQLTVKPVGDQFVSGDLRRYSCISILQLTE